MADASDCDAFNRAATLENEKEKEKETPLSQEEQQHSVLDLVQETAFVQDQPLASAEKESELEVKKQRLLEELESALLPKGKPKDSMQDSPLPVPVAVGPSIGLGLGIEVIDETALVETLSLPAFASASASGTGKGKGKKGSANAAAAKKDGNKQSSSRRRAKKDALKQLKIGKKTTTAEPPATNTNGKKRMYSRKDMEALRFVNVGQQRTFWNAIYASLQPHVANEYDTLLAVAVAVATTSTNDAGVCLPNKKRAPPILSVGAAKGRWRYMNVFVH